LATCAANTIGSLSMRTVSNWAPVSGPPSTDDLPGGLLSSGNGATARASHGSSVPGHVFRQRNSPVVVVARSPSATRSSSNISKIGSYAASARAWTRSSRRQTTPLLRSCRAPSRQCANCARIAGSAVLTGHRRQPSLGAVSWSNGFGGESPLMRMARFGRRCCGPLTWSSQTASACGLCLTSLLQARPLPVGRTRDASSAPRAAASR
jgi:hypothetical protein